VEGEAEAVVEEGGEEEGVFKGQVGVEVAVGVTAEGEGIDQPIKPYFSEMNVLIFSSHSVHFA
jgi:hypothetical protein